MRYDVVWTRRAEDQLARIWNYVKEEAISPAIADLTQLRHSELDAVTRSLEQIDQVLSRRAMLVGRGFQESKSRRIFGIGPIEVGYDVDENSQTVRVIVVAYRAQRQ